jgi:hypothetical protein
VADAGWDYLGSILECGCLADSDCATSPRGRRCDSDPGESGLFDRCGCQTSEDCPAGASCIPQFGTDAGVCDTCLSDLDCSAGVLCVETPGAQLGACKEYCSRDSECGAGLFCDPHDTCRPRCDPGYICAPPYPICDENDRVGRNGKSNSAGDGGQVWCYGCLDSSQCADGLGCDPNLNDCLPCTSSAYCVAGDVCLADGSCHPTCDAGSCPDGEFCDGFDLAGNGPNVCYQCITAADCPYPQGCDHLTHLCGSCRGPMAGETDAGVVLGGPYDCPPDSLCSNFWVGGTGVCLPICDRNACPPSLPICLQFPEITPDHDICVSCLQDSDCIDAGPGFWCDISVNRTFQCEPGLVAP